ncbi:MAG: TylF/MycF family methyltransferase [Dehalococcoidia bacterium]|nr:TylF/MycF family methyltransferase [Dehalococcoidia bacterium]
MAFDATPAALYEELGIGGLSGEASPASLYLDMVKRTLCNLIYEDPPLWPHKQPFDIRSRVLGQDMPTQAHTMVGWRRLTNIEACGRAIIEGGIPGDWVETGVGRGGASIMMRAVLQAYGATDRRVFACDTFAKPWEPPRTFARRAATKLVLMNVSLLTRVPSKRWRASLFRRLERRQQSFPRSANPSPELVDLSIEGVRHFADHAWTFFSLVDKDRSSLDAVRSHFARYGLLDSQVEFLRGFFADTLPRADLRSIGLLRCDGDTYESTRTVLDLLYAKVSHGGFVIIDDYNIPDCKRAVEDFRTENEITDALVQIDENGVFWRKM